MSIARKQCGINIVSGFVPVDMSGGANEGDYVNLTNYKSVIVVLFKAVGTAGDDPTLTLTQATAADGTGAKALEIIDVAFTKQDSLLSGVADYTKVTQTAASTLTDATSAEDQAIWQVEVQATELDLANGFTFLKCGVADVGTNAQIGCAFYIMGEPRLEASPENLVTAIS